MRMHSLHQQIHTHVRYSLSLVLSILSGLPAVGRFTVGHKMPQVVAAATHQYWLRPAFREGGGVRGEGTTTVPACTLLCTVLFYNFRHEFVMPQIPSSGCQNCCCCHCCCCRCYLCCCCQGASQRRTNWPTPAATCQSGNHKYFITFALAKGPTVHSGMSCGKN